MENCVFKPATCHIQTRYTQAMNNQLLELYNKEFGKLIPKLNEYNENVEFDKKATNPFLIKVAENYQDFKNRIMIFGQETNTWCKECGNKSAFSNNIERSLQIYQKFYLDGGINHYRGPFWNEFKRIKKEVSKKNNATFVWNNINKIGKIGKGNLNEINKIQFKNLDVIRDELKILKPNIVIFLTGHDYDFFIQKNIGNFSQNDVEKNLYELDFGNDFESIKFYKTFHPNALYRKGINKIVISNLINRVENACV